MDKMDIGYSVEPPDKLWIGFPEPLTNISAAVLIERCIFPKFSTPKKPWRYEGPWPYDGDIQRMSRSENRYLRVSRKLELANRGAGEDADKIEDGPERIEICDGERFRWTHALLPNDYRGGLNTHRWGVVIIPHPHQTYYINQMVKTINAGGEGITQEMQKINELETRVILDLLNNYWQVMDSKLQTTRKFREELIDSMLKNLRSNQNLRKYHFGELPLFFHQGCRNFAGFPNSLLQGNEITRYNIFLKDQTELAFVKLSDGLLESERAVTRGELARMYSDLEERYAHLLKRNQESTSLRVVSDVA